MERAGRFRHEGAGRTQHITPPPPNFPLLQLCMLHLSIRASCSRCLQLLLAECAAGRVTTRRSMPRLASRLPNSCLTGGFGTVDACDSFCKICCR